MPLPWLSTPESHTPEFDVVEWVPSLSTHRTFVPAEIVRLLGRKAKLTTVTRSTTTRRAGPSGLPVVRWSAATTAGVSPTRTTISPAAATRMGPFTMENLPYQENADATRSLSGNANRS